MAGDASAFEALVSRYKDMVYTMCCYLLGDAHEAEDLSQEVFIKVFRSLEGFRHESSFSTWLHVITLNTCRNRLTSLPFRIKKKMVSLIRNDEEGGLFPDIPDKAPLANGELIRHERMVRVRKAIAELSPDHKEVIVLRDIEGLSYEEIAEATGKDLGTVKSRIARARRQIKERLKGV